MNATNTESRKTGIKTRFEAVKTWGSEPKGKKIIHTAAFALIAFFWTYLIAGSHKIGLVYAVSAIAVSVLQKILEKKKIFSTLVFWAVTGIAFAVSLALGGSAMVWLAAGTWLIVSWTFKKHVKLKEWCVGAIIPFAVVMYAEYLQDNILRALAATFTTNNISRFGYAVSVVLVMVVSAFFICLLNNKRIGYYISVGIFALLSNVNFFVYALTEQPFTLSDINIATTAAGVLNTQSLTTEDWVRFIMGLLFLAAFYVMITLIYKKREEKKWILQRVVPVAGLSALLVVAYLASSWLLSFLLMYNGNFKYGFIGNLYITMNDKITLPEDVKEYVIDDENDEGEYKPNVIIVMNEAFSDFGTTFDLSLTEDPLEYFHSLQEEYPSGITYSSVRGNNTCSSEWEVLSGSPTALTAKGAMVYQNNCKPMRSLVSLFNSRGYTTVGLHPYYSFGYNRNAFYDALGFEQTLFLDDMPEEELDTVRNFVTDEENYKQLIALYEQNEAAGDEPFFCFNITMQNHGGYTKMQMDDVQITGDKTYSDINTYLSVINKSDEALKTLISYFESVEEDTIILFFGDHQPMIDKTFYEDIYGKTTGEFTLEETKDMYEVPYLIWANYDINKDVAPAETSNCYLSNILFEVGGIPKSTWLNMVDEYMVEYPVISAVFIKEADGDIKTKDTILKNEVGGTSDLLREYQKYSYGILYGRKK